MKKINIGIHNIAIFPPFIVDNSMRLSVIQMNILAILLAEMGSKYNESNNLEYTLDARDYIDKARISIRIALREFKQLSNNGAANAWTIVLPSDNANDETLSILDSIDYDDARLKLKISKDFYDKYTEFITHEGKFTNDTFRVYVNLKDFLSLRSTYSKKIYLMCCKFIAGGFRSEANWNMFCWRLQIPKSYTTAQIKNRILNHSCDEITQTTKIIVDYRLIEEIVSGGKKPTKLTFFISKKEDYPDAGSTNFSSEKSENDTSQSEKEMLEFLKKKALQG